MSIYTRLESPPERTRADDDWTLDHGGIECEQCEAVVAEGEWSTCDECEYQFCRACLHKESGVEWCDACGKPDLDQ